MYKVTGMTCGHCAETVTKAIKSVAPAADVKVDIKKGTVGVVGQHDGSRVVAAIKAAGYTAQPA